MDELPCDVVRLIVERACTISPTPRAVCRSWRAMIDASLEQRHRAKLDAMLKACRIHLRSQRSRRRHLLLYEFGWTPSAGRYRCGRCTRAVDDIAECTRCRGCLHRFPVRRALLGPALAAAVAGALWVQTRRR